MGSNPIFSSESWVNSVCSTITFAKVNRSHRMIRDQKQLISNSRLDQYQYSVQNKDWCKSLLEGTVHYFDLTISLREKVILNYVIQFYNLLKKIITYRSWRTEFQNLGSLYIWCLQFNGRMEDCGSSDQGSNPGDTQKNRCEERSEN